MFLLHKGSIAFLFYYIFYKSKKFANYFNFLSNDSNTPTRTDKIRLNKNAHQKLSIVTPTIKVSASSIITVLITKVNSPSVSKLIGRVSNTKIGLSTVLNKNKIINNLIKIILKISNKEKFNFSIYIKRNHPL